MAQLCPPKISCVFFSHVNLSDGLTILTGDRAIKLKEKESEVTEQLVKSYFSCLLTMQECPSFAKTIFFIPQSQGLGKKKTLSSISHTLAVCVWMCVCSGKCLVMSQHSFSLSGLLRRSYIKYTHSYTKVLVCPNTCSSNTSPHVFKLNRLDAVPWSWLIINVQRRLNNPLWFTLAYNFSNVRFELLCCYKISQRGFFFFFFWYMHSLALE